MSINLAGLMSQLHLGLDILPITDWRSVPHALDPHHTPRYTVEVWNPEEDSWEPDREAPDDVDEMVEYAHWSSGIVRFCEDGFPVFIRG